MQHADKLPDVAIGVHRNSDHEPRHIDTSPGGWRLIRTVPPEYRKSGESGEGDKEHRDDDCDSNVDHLVQGLQEDDDADEELDEPDQSGWPAWMVRLYAEFAGLDMGETGGEWRRALVSWVGFEKLFDYQQLVSDS